MTLRSLTLILLLHTVPVGADDLLEQAWPETSTCLEETGSGVAIVFSPDLSVEGNCRFYQSLGFACFESADWLRIVADIETFNHGHQENRIRTVLLETHGTNGHGLKVQEGKGAADTRSYVSVAALEELLGPAGVENIVISACNSGRLLRPQIYRRLNRNSGDKLFLPASHGIVDASRSFDPKQSCVTVLTPAESQIETMLIGSLRELTPATREILEAAAIRRGIELPRRFAISEMLIHMLLRDPRLELRTGAHVEELSRAQSSPEASEELFRAFVAHLDRLAR